MPYATTFPLITNILPGPDALSTAKEIIKDKLYFLSVSQLPSQNSQTHFFSIDDVLTYVAFYADFGPNNLAHVIRFCDLLNDKFINPATCNKKICLYTDTDNDKRANAAFLMSSYMLLVHKQSPEDAFRPFQSINPPFQPYRDAGYGAATYHITVLDCLNGLFKALNTGLLDLDALDLEAYEFYEKVENGDMNWICDKFLALASPHDDPVLPGTYAPGTPGATSRNNPGPAATYSGMLANGFPAAVAGIVARSAYMPAPQASELDRPLLAGQKKRLVSAFKIDDLVRYLKDNKVASLVRLNNKIYESKRFVDAGLEHVELYFPDGTTPSDPILKKFLELCETRQGAIAIHCKAGLGRTGTLIAAYLMKHYRFTTSEVIGYLRVMRPGSVVGPQQNFLQSLQPKLWKLTPSTKLPQSVSLLRTPNFYTMKRFVIPPVLANVMVPLPKSHDAMDYYNISVASPMSVDNCEKEASDVDDETFSDASESDNIDVLTAHVDMPVPLQPRKPGVNGGQADAAGVGPGSAASARTNDWKILSSQQQSRPGTNFTSSVSSIVSSVYSSVTPQSTTSSSTSLHSTSSSSSLHRHQQPSSHGAYSSNTSRESVSPRYNLRSPSQGDASIAAVVASQGQRITPQAQLTATQLIQQGVTNTNNKYGAVSNDNQTRASVQFAVQGRSASTGSAKEAGQR
ncbi:hypothetical protein SeMB42_g00143 [Synchytrium endobioticum]|uniref:protein-tyrosine-phosphatase n=1 Tax=Synchytrium endobioticum TaxID=286115 RepID=A0A507DEZ7_9FUNG|nr:hypothetical protein SeLEV6574_g01097 [Synchytrium endobioticum]TPX54662.1 hypothetical protein SeMB42_g00143 [Synchytrium endobioticum]